MIQTTCYEIISMQMIISGEKIQGTAMRSPKTTDQSRWWVVCWMDEWVDKKVVTMTPLQISKPL